MLTAELIQQSNAANGHPTASGSSAPDEKLTEVIIDPPAQSSAATDAERISGKSCCQAIEPSAPSEGDASIASFSYSSESDIKNTGISWNENEATDCFPGCRLSDRILASCRMGDHVDIGDCGGQEVSDIVDHVEHEQPAEAPQTERKCNN